MQSKANKKRDILKDKKLEKIRIMTKLAIYDKRYFEKDSKANSYFRHDYIYKQNMRMRFFLALGCIILIFFYILHIIMIQEIDIFSINFIQLSLRLLFFVFIVMIAYSFLGTILYTREFLKSQRRISKYFRFMDELSELSNKKNNQYQSSVQSRSFYDHEENPDIYIPRKGYLYRYSDKLQAKTKEDKNEL